MPVMPVLSASYSISMILVSTELSVLRTVRSDDEKIEYLLAIISY